MGPLPERQNDKKYIMTATDYFSKWQEAKAVLSKEACQVLDFLYSLFMQLDFVPLLSLTKAVSFATKCMTSFLN